MNLLSSEALQIYFQHYKGANKISFNALGDSRNAIPLEHLSNGRGVHTQHGDYEAALRAWIESKWNKIDERSISVDKKLGRFHKEIEKLTKALQSELIEQSV